MSGMLPIQDYSQAVTQHREREVRDQVKRRSARGRGPDIRRGPGR